jgi:hypothetical protein
MPGETIARSGPLSGAPDEDDYQAFCQALSTSERGRAFLAEDARRNKNVDTEQLLAAIEQLQSVMVAQSTPQATDPIRRGCVTSSTRSVPPSATLRHSFWLRRRRRLPN